MGLEQVVSTKARFFSRTKYQRLGSDQQRHRSGSVRTVELVDPQRRRRRRRIWRVKPRKIRLRRLLRGIGSGGSGILLVPRLLLQKAKDSYVKMVVSFAGKRDNAGLVAMGHSVMSGGAAPFRTPLKNTTAMSNKDLDRLLRRAIAQGRFGPDPESL